MMQKVIKKFKFDDKKWLAIALTIFLSLALVAIVVNLFIDQKYEDKFYPGVKVAGVSLGGLSQTQAQKIFKAKINELNKDGIVFAYGSRHLTLYPLAISATDPDLTREIINFQLDQTLNNAYNLGRSNFFWPNLLEKVKQLVIPTRFTLTLDIDEGEIEKILVNNFKDLERLGHNPQLKWQGEAIKVEKEKVGLVFDYGVAIEKMKNNLSELDFEPITMELNLKQPNFGVSEAQKLVSQIKSVLNLAPLTLYAMSDNQLNRKSWFVSREEVKNWLDFGWNEKDKKAELVFKLEAVEKTLTPIKKEVEQEVKEAKFALRDGRVTEFQASQLGRAIDLSATVENLVNEIIKQKKAEAEIVVKKIEPQANTGNINDLGIKELVGTGRSNFSGSPVNRRHNIKVGATSLNGLLIKPGEKFSLNQALGEITPAKGYLPELVIKGNKTVPEYGGGLCQIATTAFRLAINSGLPITERQPHAYRVIYYEPAGTDATIYSPHPDLKFINDTSNYLLFQSKVEGDDLTFEFWGTNDGREIATTTPKIFNILAPGPTKYIETTELEPKKVKCVEIAHNGADTEFTRTLTYVSGEKKEEVFKSHYRPWQAVCLVGIEPGETATSTEERVNN